VKVLLLNAPSSDGLLYLKEGRCESRAGAQLTVPITLGVAAAVVREAGHEPWLRDYAVSELDREALTAAAREARLAFLVTTTPSYPDDAAFARYLRSLHQDLVIAAWGTLPTALPERALQDAPELDLVVRGEPEGAVEDLCRLVASTAGRVRSVQFAAVPGVTYRDEAGRLHATPERTKLRELDDLPRAARELMEVERYTEPSTGRPYTVVQASRGCPYPCTYCTVASYHGKKVRRRSPESLAAEVRHCVEAYGVRSFLLLSDLFTADRRWVLDVCAALAREAPGIRWFCNSRADTIDAELARAMARAGCYLVSFGVESASESVQQVIRKPLEREAVHRAVAACREAGIRSYLYWVLGFPGETRETMLETFRFACEADSDFAVFSAAVPYPGTPLYAEAREKGWLRHELWRRYDTADTDALVLEHLAPGELAGFIRFANAAYFLRPGYVASMPRRFARDEWTSLAGRAGKYFSSILLPKDMSRWLPGASR
jgi:radical SAM superfamily enzyme YgiQ (UPF0313 family)